MDDRKHIKPKHGKSNAQNNASDVDGLLSRAIAAHNADLSVQSASMIQVRKPIYSSSVGRWRHYEKHLGPLLGVLAPILEK